MGNLGNLEIFGKKSEEINTDLQEGKTIGDTGEATNDTEVIPTEHNLQEIMNSVERVEKEIIEGENTLSEEELKHLKDELFELREKMITTKN